MSWSILSGIELTQKGFLERYSMVSPTETRDDRLCLCPQSWWAWTFPLAGFVSACGKLATFFPSKAFGVINIIFVFFIFFMYVTRSATLPIPSGPFKSQARSQR
jgi:hypothetical protein